MLEKAQRFVEHPWEVPLQSRVIGLVVLAGDLELLEGEVFVIGAAHPEVLMVPGGRRGGRVPVIELAFLQVVPPSADVQRRDLQARRRIAVRVDLAGEFAPLLAVDQLPQALQGAVTEPRWDARAAGSGRRIVDQLALVQTFPCPGFE